MFKHKKLKIRENFALGASYFMLTLEISEDVTINPGNFVMISFPCRQDLILPRPFSIFDFDNHAMKILYKVVGCGTQYLSELKENAVIECSFPLGNAFVESAGYDVVFLVGGGFGAAPMNFYLHCNVPKDSYEAQFLLGARSRDQLPYIKQLCASAKNVLSVATDDGSDGFKGFVTELFMEKLAEVKKDARILVLSCGPEVMMYALARLVKSKKEEYNIDAYFSLEEKMACGFGVCSGCVVETASGYKRVCKDGTIFKLEDLIL